MNTESLPSAPVIDFDKLVHLLMFMGLSGLVFFDNTKRLKQSISRQRVAWGSFLFPTLFSGAIEIGQEYLTVNRTGDWFDFLFDGIGALIGILICFLINRRLKPAAVH
jgi:VanZ family protein